MKVYKTDAVEVSYVPDQSLLVADLPLPSSAHAQSNQGAVLAAISLRFLRFVMEMGF